MLDLNHLPKTGNGNIDYFYNTGNSSITTSNSWQTWEKPRGIHTIFITCIGAGGGGRSGQVASSSSGQGGAGGGSGGFTRLLIPAMVLPDVLYVTVGKGGAGGEAGTPAVTGNLGISGTASYVSIAPSTDAIYVACFANAGGAPPSFTTSSIGAAAAIATQVNAIMSGLGLFTAAAGQSGTAGNTSAGTSITYPTTGLLLSGGASGGGNSTGSTQVGGSIIMPTQSSFSLIPIRNGGPGTGAVAAPGSDGITLLQPLMSTGGAGAGKGPNRGGNGGLGSGGGGGGASLSNAVNSGAGGNGGDGLVIIQTF